MSFRSLGYLLTRRFYPRKICSRQAEFLPGISPLCRRLAGQDVLYTHSDLSNGDNAFGPAVATALLGGGLGILIFKEHPDDSDNNVTDKDTKEVRSNKPMQVQVTNMEKRDVDMEARFHEWMTLFGRVYPNHEEETRRFEVFKERMKLVDSLKGSLFEYHPNKFADMSNREILDGRRRHKGSSRRDFQEYEEEALLRFSQEAMLVVREEKSRAAQKQ